MKIALFNTFRNLSMLLAKVGIIIEIIEIIWQKFENLLYLLTEKQQNEKFACQEVPWNEKNKR